MISLFRRANRIFYIVYEINGKRKWKSTGCTQKSHAYQLLVNFNLSSATSVRKVSFSQFVHEFLEYAPQNYTPGSVSLFRNVLETFRKVLQLSPEFPLWSITQRQIDTYKTERLKKVSPVTMNIELRTLRSAFNTARRWELLQDNPLSGSILVRVPERQPAYVAKVDFQKLLTAAASSSWLQDIILFATQTGMRRGELLNLQWKDLDMKQRLIHIRSSESFQTKTKKSRAVPMNFCIYQMLEKRPNQVETSYVFSIAGHKISASYLTHRFKRCVRRAGLSEDIHWHSLRHTFATWLVQSSVNIYEVQKLLGHSSVAMTEVYSHLAASELHDAVSRIEFTTSEEHPESQ